MKVFAVLLLASMAVGHYPTLYPEAEVQTETSEWRQFYKFAVAKAMESCLGKDTVNKYTVNMKKAVAKCQQEEAPELDLPPYRSMYKFVNTIIKSADQMDQFKMKMMFHTMRQMSNHYNNKHHSESNWLQEQFRKDKMQKMMKEMMHGNFDDSESVQFKPYSMDHGMKNNQMKKYKMQKMMKEMMRDNRYSDSFNQHDTMKMMKNVFGNEYSNDHYDMMEKYFKNDNDMDAFEMMKMMMKFSGDESNIDMSQMMHSMEKMYGNDYKMNEHDMKNFESHESYAPPQ